MGDRIYLNFFVDEDHTFDYRNVYISFIDTQGSYIDIGDNYEYLKDPNNKKAIKEDLKEHFEESNISLVNYSGTKGIYKELKELLEVMKTYESRTL